MHKQSRAACIPGLASCKNSAIAQLNYDFICINAWFSRDYAWPTLTSYGIISLNRSKAFPRSCSGSKSSLKTRIRPLIKPVSNNCRNQPDSGAN